MNKENAMNIVSFFPALLVMYLIFGFSGDTGEESSSLSVKVTEQVVIVLEQVVANVVPDGQAKIEFTDTLHGVIRKLAHMIEYAVLTFTWLFALWVNGLHGKKLLYVTGLVCFLYACTDEIHQMFVPERSGKFLDVYIDMVGVGTALALICMLQRLKKKE